MSEKWDKLWENLIGYLNHLNNKNLITGWLADIKAVGDGMRDAIATGYCGECDVLKEENKQLQERNIDLFVHTARLDFELEQNKQKLEAIRGVVAEYPKCDKTGLAFEWDELITRILEVLG